MIASPDMIESIFLPYQLRWIRDRSRMRLALKSRQIGWTWINAFEDALNGLGTERHPNVYYLGADNEAAKAYIADVTMWAEKLKETAHAFTEEEYDEVDDVKYKIHIVEFPNGSRVEATSSNPRRLRGKRGNVKLDEFAFHEDQVELLRAAMPVTTWGYQVSAWSTYNGEGNPFYQMVQMGERQREGNPKRGDMNWNLHVVTLEDAIADGLVDKINELTGRDMTADEFREECRGKCLTQDDFDQEYMCIVSAESAAWIPWSLLAPCISDDVPMPTESLDRFLQDIMATSAESIRLYVGNDIGRTRDLFVLWALGQLGTRFNTVGLLSWTGRKFSVMQQSIERTMKLRTPQGGRVKRACIDATGMGMQLGEWAEDTYRGRAEAVTFTNAVKEDLAGVTKRHIEDINVIVPNDEIVIDHIRSVRKQVTSAGKIRYAGERTKDGHADFFWGLALGLHAADTGQARGRIITVKGGVDT